MADERSGWMRLFGGRRGPGRAVPPGAMASAGGEGGLKVNYLDEEAPDRLMPPPGSSVYSAAAGLDAVPAAYAAVNLLTEQMAMLPRRVVRRDKTTGIEEALPDHPVSTLLRFPSRMLDPQQFWRMVIRQWVGRGNAFCHIRREAFGKYAVELVPAACLRCDFVQSRASPYQVYDLKLLGGSGTGGRFVSGVRSSDVLAIHGPGYDGLRSPSPIEYVGRPFLSTMQQSVSRYEAAVTRGVTSGNVLVPREGALNTWDQWKEAAKRLREGFGKAERAGAMVLMPPGVDIATLSALSPLDLQLIQLLTWGVEEVARVFGVSPIRLAHYHEGMRARTFESQAADFERYSIAPRLAELDEQLSRKLLKPSELLAGMKVSTDGGPIGLGTMGERLAAADLAVARAGIWTINEARAMTGLPPHPDGDRLIQPKGAPAQAEGRKDNAGDVDEGP